MTARTLPSPLPPFQRCRCGTLHRAWSNVPCRRCALEDKPDRQALTNAIEDQRRQRLAAQGIDLDELRAERAAEIAATPGFLDT